MVAILGSIRYVVSFPRVGMVVIRGLMMSLGRKIHFRLKRLISDRLFKALYIQMGYGKLSLISFPNNHEDSQLEL